MQHVLLATLPKMEREFARKCCACCRVSKPKEGGECDVPDAADTGVQPRLGEPLCSKAITGKDAQVEPEGMGSRVEGVEHRRAPSRFRLSCRSLARVGKFIAVGKL